MPTMLLCHDTAFARFRLTWGWDDAIPPHMRGMTAEYDSAEHAFQALRSADVATAIAFESGGLVSPALMDRWPKASYLKTRARTSRRSWTPSLDGVRVALVIQIASLMASLTAASMRTL